MAFEAFGVAQARAGSYTITASGAQACALGTFIENVPGFGASCTNGDVYLTAPNGGSAYNDRQLWQIDSPSSALTITGANLLAVSTVNINTGSPGYGGGVYWNGGGQPLNVPSQAEETFGSDSTSPAFSSQYFGMQIVCSDTKDCDGTGTQSGAYIANLGPVSLAVQENQAPSLIADGANLFYETSGWVWNPPGDPWPASASGSDPSGVCTVTVAVNGTVASQVSMPPNESTWQQCPSPQTDNTSVDTTSFVPGSGQLSLGLSDTNAAGVSNAASSTINVDNVAPQVSIAAQNDPNPGGWSVNHAVTLNVTPTVGPSGINSFTCQDTVGKVTTPLTLSPGSVSGTDAVTIDGNGAHTVSCGVANNAVDPQGVNNTGAAAETVDIDEQPPSLSFEPTNPANPDQVVVDTSDDESPVNGGTIEITPQGSSTPMALPTTFNSAGQLVATIPDGTLAAGPYTLEASATSQVGNTGTTSESVSLPLRTPTVAAVSFAKISNPLIAKKVKERVRVGFHYVVEKRHGKRIRVKRGGHYTTITVIKRVEACATRRARVALHTWKLQTSCPAPTVTYQDALTVGFGKTTTVYGELTTSQGLPVANQAVEIEATPANSGATSATVATATTDADGGWSATVPAGPSRTISAVYPGGNTLLPASSSAELTVPARIAISIKPRRLRWSGYLRITGHLVGGYVPADGVALRLLVRYPGSRAASPLLAFRTNASGNFSIRWTFNAGRGTLKLPFWVATDSNESDYPYSAAGSRRIGVTFTQ
jgi:hypothetical protein